MRQGRKGPKYQKKLRTSHVEGPQDGGLDTVEANRELGFPDELRSYACVPDILGDLGVSSVRLMTNNPFKVAALQGGNSIDLG